MAKCFGCFPFPPSYQGQVYWNRGHESDFYQIVRSRRDLVSGGESQHLGNLRAVRATTTTSAAFGGNRRGRRRLHRHLPNRFSVLFKTLRHGKCRADANNTLTARRARARAWICATSLMKTRTNLCTMSPIRNASLIRNKRHRSPEILRWTQSADCWEVASFDTRLARPPSQLLHRKVPHWPPRRHSNETLRTYLRDATRGYPTA